jgi:hypothetical protein
MIIINIAISKTYTIIFEIDIAYVSNLAHAWFSSEQNRLRQLSWYYINVSINIRKLIRAFDFQASLHGSPVTGAGAVAGPSSALLLKSQSTSAATNFAPFSFSSAQDHDQVSML